MNKWLKNYTLKVQGTDNNYHIINPPFTIKFKIEKKIMSERNNAEITVVNLNKNTRNKLFKDWSDQSADHRKGIELKAGYGDSLTTIFKGDVITCYNRKDKVNWYTELTCHDGFVASVNSRSKLSYKNGVSKKELIERLMNDFISSYITPKLLKSPYSIGFVSSYSGFTYYNSISEEGPTIQLLDKYCDGDFFISDNKLYSISRQDTISGVFPLISNQTGLLGSPRRSANYIEVDMIFEPRLRLKQFVDLQAEVETNNMYNGKMQVIGFSHSGEISSSVDSELVTNVILWSGKTRSIL